MKPSNTKKMKTVPEKINKTKEEAAIELLKKVEEEKIEKATNELHNFLTKWSNEHGVGIQTRGQFIGNSLTTELVVVRIKK